MDKAQFKFGFLICVAIGCVLLFMGNRAYTQAGSEVKTPVYGVKVVNTYEHDKQAFTQGLLYHDGFLYESTGVRGRSTMRKVKLETGEVLKKIKLPDSMFGEGLALWKEQFVQLSWQAIQRLFKK